MYRPGSGIDELSNRGRCRGRLFVRTGLSGLRDDAWTLGRFVAFFSLAIILADNGNSRLILPLSAILRHSNGMMSIEYCR